VGATAFIAGITAVDLVAAVRGTLRSRRSGGRRMELTATTTVLKDAQELYAYWRDLENLPSFMSHVLEVRSVDEGRSHWRVEAPGGRTVEWDAEVVEDVPGDRLSWRSVGKTSVPNSGEVRFRPAPGDRGTEVYVRLEYDLPAGKLGELVARFAGQDPHQQVTDDLRRFKQVMETGEVVRSESTPEGTRTTRQLRQRPAQPLARGGFR
jgi:uncharacterized membrane protein